MALEAWEKNGLLLDTLSDHAALPRPNNAGAGVLVRSGGAACAAGSRIISKTLPLALS